MMAVLNGHAMEESTTDDRQGLGRPIPGARQAVLAVVGLGLASGLAAAFLDHDDVANALWLATSVAGLITLCFSIVRGLAHRRAGVDLIALLAIAGALALGEFLAGAVISVMLASGQALEEYAAARSRRELTALLARAPRVVHLYADGVVTSVSPADVAAGDLLLVMSGEVVPVDGVVVSDIAILDEAALTGEARPVDHPAGDHVRSGTLNAGSPFDLRALSTAEQSTYAGIVRLVAEAQRSRAPSTRMADRFALLFVPLTLAIAGVAWLVSGDAVRALAVLVVATPCPLILAVPVALVSGISRAARRGIIVKGGEALEKLAGAEVLLFDKTGTLTMGRPQIADIEVQGQFDAHELLRLAASVEQMSPHVLANAFVQAASGASVTLLSVSNFEEVSGMGIRGFVDGHSVAVGRLDFVAPDVPPPPWVRGFRRRVAFEGFASTFVSVDGVLAGAITLEDPLRPDSPRTLRTVRKAGIRRVVMVTGDRSEVAEAIGEIVGTDAVYAERTPAEKVDVVREERVNGLTVMVGDGINDAPALAVADLGVAMGARGATASSEAADVVLLVDRLDRLAEGMQVSRRARSIALQSVLAGMSLSLVGMGFAAVGLLTPVAGALAQETIDVAVIMNALRALGGYRGRSAPPRAAPALARRFQAEHAELLPLVDEIRTTADHLEDGDNAHSIPKLRRIHRMLVERILPHEEAEEKVFYPEIASMLGGDDPTATMSRGHVEIAHLVRVLGVLLDEIGEGSPQAGDVVDLRRVLYGLHAILRLHFSQEDEAYLSLSEFQEAH